MQTASLPFQLPFTGGDSAGQGKSPRNALRLPFSLPFVGSSKRDSAGSADGKAGGLAPTRHSTSAIDAAHVQNVSLELQLKQAALENTLSDTMVENVHTQEKLAQANNNLQEAAAHIEEHSARETMMAVTIDSLEEVLCRLQHEMEERLDVEELVGFRSYSQKRDKELQSRLHLLQDMNDQKDVIIQEQASEIAWLKNEVSQRTSDLDVALDDLKTSATREWKKHRSVCMEIGGMYIDFNHREDVGLTMDRSSKFGPDELGMVGVGLKLGNIFPFEILAVHPDSRTTDGLPAILHEGDKIVAIDEVNCENLTKADVNALIIGPAESSVNLKFLRGVNAPRERKTLQMKRLHLNSSVGLRAPRHASHSASSYSQYVAQREFFFHLPPSGTELVGDFEVWEVLLSEGKTVLEHPLAFQFDDKLLHQPTFLEGQFDHGKPLCCVWDVNNGDVYYRGPQGPPLDVEKMRKRAEDKARAIEEAARVSEERRIKVAELEAKMKAEVEMRAKLEAEAKLKLERQGELKQEMLEKARNEIEERMRASGPLPLVEPLALPAPQSSNRTVDQAKLAPAVPAAKPVAKPATDASVEKPVPAADTALEIPDRAPPVAIPEATTQPRADTTSEPLAEVKRGAGAGKTEVDTLTAEERELEEEIARLAAEEAAKRAAEQLGRLKEARAAADEAAATAPAEVEAEEDEPSRGAGGGSSSARTSSNSPGRNKTKKKKSKK